MLWLLAQSTPPVSLPPIPREFRAAWVATVDNIDWPSTRTLSVANQKREMEVLLDKAAALHLNAIILQVRPSADALYSSSIEPWSEFLTGKQGVGPVPAYDPLQFAVQEAHRRGILIHCWLNPYRARHPAMKGALAGNHLAKTNPSVVKTYGRYLWMDPGEPFVQKRLLNVTTDLLTRYDIDGIHIDDYFYPYKEGNQDFPDEPSYSRYRNQGGTLGRDDWRRKNVDDLIHSIYDTIHHVRPTALFGISPFGIYRPGVPAGIKAGVDQYAELYADARKWFREGWCDYLAPQLYWPIAQKPQSYPVLLKYWVGENVKSRHLWIGNYTSRTSPDEGNWKAAEIVRQVQLTRTAGATGNIHFSMKALMMDYNGVSDALRGRPYSLRSLPPKTPWIDDLPPQTPTLKQTGDTFEWSSDTPPMWWAVWRRYGKRWLRDVLPGSQTKLTAPKDLLGRPLSLFAVEAVDRLGNESRPRVWQPE
jgi:uncharacterized lipoprotein YddW (UPF0748 family)